ncbi:MAG TPA: hypothetical protein VHN80_09975 [Kineosporiaceae bacterium]|nr:hypothetical protein [Kineosporiaceae bacterium]
MAERQRDVEGMAATAATGGGVRSRFGVRGLTGRGGGAVGFVSVPLESQGTTRQVAGLYPFGVPGRLPQTAVPIGRHQLGAGVVCFDPATWFLDGLIANPSVLVLAKPGLGKSTLVDHWAIGLAAMGYRILVPGDTKPDHVEMTRVLGGTVQTVQRAGGAALNPCDPGGMAVAAGLIGGEAGQALLHEAIGRSATAVHSLIHLIRDGNGVHDYERAAIATALRVLYTGGQQTAPVLPDLLKVLGQRPDQVRAVVLARGDDGDYDTLIDPLQRSLLALLAGPFGNVFSRPVERADLDTPVLNIDTSAIKAGDPGYLAAVLIAAWSEAYGRVEAAQALSAAGLAPRRRYVLILDELWRVLRAAGGAGMADRVNELTRLNRTDGVCQIMVTHGIRDLSTGRDQQVEGIEHRAGSLVIGGIPAQEVEALAGVVSLTDSEAAALISWSSATDLDPRSRPPGSGKFLIKHSPTEPGIPVDVLLTETELAWGGQNSNQAWEG